MKVRSLICLAEYLPEDAYQKLCVHLMILIIWANTIVTVETVRKIENRRFNFCQNTLRDQSRYSLVFVRFQIFLWT